MYSELAAVLLYLQHILCHAYHSIKYDINSSGGVQCGTLSSNYKQLTRVDGHVSTASTRNWAKGLVQPQLVPIQQQNVFVQQYLYTYDR